MRVSRNFYKKCKNDSVLKLDVLIQEKKIVQYRAGVEFSE